MIWFDYKYKTMSEVLGDSTLIADLSPQSISLIIVLSFLLILIIFYLIPFGIIVIRHRIQVKQRIRKRHFLKQIVMQREIEEEIEKEIEKEEKELG